MKIEILPNPDKDTGLRYTKELVRVLLNHPCSIWMPNAYSGCGIEGVEFGECTQPDVIVVLGGDGSIMRAAHTASLKGCKILGVNLGRVGFLCELEVSELELAEKLFSRDYRIDKRMMLDISVKGKKLSSGLAVNDAVVSHGKVSRLVDCEVFCDGSSLGVYRSDGFIVSTPTGSTAYSLSAGGPVIDPSLKGILLVPICPHSLTARPIIVPDTSVIEIKYLGTDKTNAYLTVDGEEAAELLPSDSVRIVRSEKHTDIVRINRESDRNFYKILRKKMSDI